MLKKLRIVAVLLAVSLAGAVPMHAQVTDTHVSYSGNQVSVFSGVLSKRFQSTGSGAYIFAVQPNAATNFFITNTGGAGNALTLTYQVAISGSPIVADYSNNVLSWTFPNTYDAQNSLQTSGQPQTLVLSGNATQQIQVPVSGASQIAIIFTNANGATIPLSLNVVFTANGTLPKTSAANVNIQPQTTFNSDQTGAANQQIQATISAATGRSAYLYSIAGFCTGGSASLTVVNGSQTIWHTPSNAVQTTFISFDWPVPLAGSPGVGFVITLSTCGATNVGTLIVQASQQ